MSFFIVEAVYGLGMRQADIPLHVRREQMMVSEVAVG